jgi:hypothetical protein
MLPYFNATTYDVTQIGSWSYVMASQAGSALRIRRVALVLSDRLAGLVAEEVFAGSTDVALAAIADSRPGSERLTVAADLALATTVALSLGDVAAARWLRAAGGAWRWSTYEPLIPPAVGYRTRWHRVWASQMHMLFNRLGVTPHAQANRRHAGTHHRRPTKTALTSRNTPQNEDGESKNAKCALGHMLSGHGRGCPTHPVVESAAWLSTSSGG